MLLPEKLSVPLPLVMARRVAVTLVVTVTAAFVPKVTLSMLAKVLEAPPLRVTQFVDVVFQSPAAPPFQRRLSVA